MFRYAYCLMRVMNGSAGPTKKKAIRLVLRWISQHIHDSVYTPIGEYSRTTLKKESPFHKVV